MHFDESRNRLSTPIADYRSMPRSGEQIDSPTQPTVFMHSTASTADAVRFSSPTSRKRNGRKGNPGPSSRLLSPIRGRSPERLKAVNGFQENGHLRETQRQDNDDVNKVARASALLTPSPKPSRRPMREKTPAEAAQLKASIAFLSRLSTPRKVRIPHARNAMSHQ